MHFDRESDTGALSFEILGLKFAACPRHRGYGANGHTVLNQGTGSDEYEDVKSARSSRNGGPDAGLSRKCSAGSGIDWRY